MQELISVIIPVYKSESFLRNCIDSVLSQSYSYLEIILVDDGSPDNCPLICDEYAKKDTRVRVIHKPNGGASSARNAGLETAKGKYIVFVDSDDAVPKNGLEALYNAMERTGADYGAGVCKVMSRSSYKNMITAEEYFEFDKEPKMLLKYIVQSGSYSPYAKIYRNDIIRHNKLRFSESLKCSEDALFIRQYLLCSSNTVLVPDVVYEYNTSNDSSLSKKGYEFYCEYYIEKLKALRQLCDILPIEQKEKDLFVSYRAVHGLRICTNHYLNNWESLDEKIRLVKKSIALIKPWLDFSDENYSDMDNLTLNWWKNKKKLIQESKFDDYYKIVNDESRKAKSNFILKLKRKLKKLIGRYIR